MDNNNSKDKDLFLNNNLDLIYDICEKEKKYINEFKKEYKDLPYMDVKTVKTLVKDILEEIDLEWLDIYNEAIASGNIIVLNELDVESLYRLLLGLKTFGICEDDIINTCLCLGNKDRYLFLKYDGNINDIIFTIHEVIHYINEVKDNGRNILPVVREFPSIFYEMYAYKYLSRLGYDNEIISVCNNRLDDIDEALKFTMNILNNINDNNINLLRQSYPYVVGHYLARLMVGRIDNDKLLLPMMKYITNNLSKIDIDDIFNLLEVNTKKRILK